MAVSSRHIRWLNHLSLPNQTKSWGPESLSEHPLFNVVFFFELFRKTYLFFHQTAHLVQNVNSTHNDVFCIKCLLLLYFTLLYFTSLHITRVADACTAAPSPNPHPRKTHFFGNNSAVLVTPSPHRTTHARTTLARFSVGRRLRRCPPLKSVLARASPYHPHPVPLRGVGVGGGGSVETGASNRYPAGYYHRGSYNRCFSTHTRFSCAPRQN